MACRIDFISTKSGEILLTIGFGSIHLCEHMSEVLSGEHQLVIYLKDADGAESNAAVYCKMSFLDGNPRLTFGNSGELICLSKI